MADQEILIRPAGPLDYYKKQGYHAIKPTWCMGLGERLNIQVLESG